MINGYRMNRDKIQPLLTFMAVSWVTSPYFFPIIQNYRLCDGAEEDVFDNDTPTGAVTGTWTPTMMMLEVLGGMGQHEENYWGPLCDILLLHLLIPQVILGTSRVNDVKHHS
jgi:hypothetical protein